jgi:hypothetical protein
LALLWQDDHWWRRRISQGWRPTIAGRPIHRRGETIGHKANGFWRRPPTSIATAVGGDDDSGGGDKRTAAATRSHHDDLSEKWFRSLAARKHQPDHTILTYGV